MASCAIHDHAVKELVLLRPHRHCARHRYHAISFAVFWSDTGSSDALGYGIAVIVVNLLGNIVLISLLPICGELIWIDLFGAVNTGFCIIALFQSAFNIMLEQKSDDSLLSSGWTICT